MDQPRLKAEPSIVVNGRGLEDRQPMLGKDGYNRIPHGGEVSILALEVRIDLIERDVLALSLRRRQRPRQVLLSTACRTG